MKPFVSVIIPTYNRAHCITDAIESVMRQTYKNYELVIVDDGSTDETRQVLEKYGSSIRYVFQTNAGPGVARNTGVQIAEGDWLAFLDSDDSWLPRKLETQLEVCTRHGACLSFHDLRFISEEGECIDSWNVHVNEGVGSGGRVRTGLVPDAYERMMIVGHLFLTPTFMVQREAFLSTGGYNTTFRTSEDIELYFRLAARYPVVWVDEILAVGHGLRTEHSVHREQLYLDRIQAIKVSLAERLSASDYRHARLAKKGVLYQTRALAGHYRRSGAIGAAAVAYLQWIGAHLRPMHRLAS